MRGNWARTEWPNASVHPADKSINSEHAYEKIISKEDFDKAQAVRNYNPKDRRIYRNGRNRYLLLGLIQCELCGYNFQGHAHNNKWGEWRYCEDGGFYNGGPSVRSSFHIPQELIEEHVIKEIKRRVISSLDIDMLERLLNERLSTLHQSNDRSERMDKINQDPAVFDQILENTNDSIEKGLPINFISDRVSQFQNMKDMLEHEKTLLLKSRITEIDRNHIKDRIVQNLDEFETVFKSGPDVRKKEILRAFVHQIKANRE